MFIFKTEEVPDKSPVNMERQWVIISRLVNQEQTGGDQVILYESTRDQTKSEDLRQNLVEHEII